MPIWPFKKRRRNSTHPEVEVASQPLIKSEKVQPDAPPRASTFPPTPSSPIPIPRRSSKRGRPPPIDLDAEKKPSSLGKENVPPGPIPISSRDAVTALPMSYQLQHSPHLRPVDMERPHIPYNFRNYSGSQTSVQPDAATSSPKPNVLRKKRSSYESGTPQRKRSTRSRKDEQLREEEIRAMSAQSPIPKRPGEGPLRRDSKKMRSGMKESEISLPAHEESVHESLPGIMEQRGWEIGSIDIFNPRPAVRLSGIPQYVTAAASPPPSGAASPELVREKEKMSMSRDSKRDTIGSRADALDANDIRLILERDAKRREKRKKEQQEKLDRKLRKEGRKRGDSDRRRREAEEDSRAKEMMTPPADIHPALRDGHVEEAGAAVGLGIAAEETAAGAADTRAEHERDIDTEEHQPEDPFVTAEEQQEDPFVDPAEEEPPRQSAEQIPESYTPLETPMEEPVVETAQAVRISQAATPPLSPVHSARATSSISQVAADSRRTSEVPVPVPIPTARRQSQPVPERRTGGLASLFKRGGTSSRKGSEAYAPPSEASFSNTSRESMRNQPLPPHLVDTQTRVPSTARRTSGTPTRTQSKFREDLPEFPISPPDSRTASPDVITAAAAAAAARRAPQPIDVQRRGSTTTSGSEAVTAGRYDTPISPSLRPGTSMASVDSEGAWLASGTGKRQSRQSGLGSRRAEFSSSYEELGTDTDAKHFSRATGGPASPETVRGVATTVGGGKDGPLPGASETTSERDFYDAPEEPESPTTAADEAPGTPTVHESVRRQPTLVHRDPRVRSREGLLTDHAGEMAEPTSATTTGRGSLEMDSDADLPEPELQRATSVRVHARHTSTGSAKLLDVPARRGSQQEGGGTGPQSPVTPRL